MYISIYKNVYISISISVCKCISINVYVSIYISVAEECLSCLHLFSNGPVVKALDS